MITWFTADTHLGHANIIKYQNRPFLSKKDMDDSLIANWNVMVDPKDEVYHLGDFCFGDKLNAAEYIRRLNGTIKVIWGNHDKAIKELKRFWHHNILPEGKVYFLHDMADIKVQGQSIVLNHYAMRTWNKSHHGAWHLYGHSHGSLSDDPTSLSFDVGVDCHNYRPISFKEVSAIMSKKHFLPIDHHGDRQEGGGIGLSRDEYAKLERKRQYEQLKKEFGNI